MLPPHDLILAQVTDIGDTRLTTGFENHPANMCVPETIVRIVGIEIGIGVPMMSTVTS
jgi:hypothetical protein